MISKQTIDEIMLSSKIEEVVGDFVSLKKRGQNWVGLCPFHSDRSPSMYVSPRLGIFKCFVCDAGGNSVHFLMEHEKISYPEALRYLAKKYNIQIEEEAEKNAEEIAQQNERESLFIVNTYAENYFTGQLFNTEEGKTIGLTYLKERGFNENTIKKFRLGYNPDGWDTFTQEALKNGYNLEHLLKTGLTKKSESGKLFDFYRGRIIFPIHNTMGKTVGFGGRILTKNDKIAKYFNSPESEIYHKSNIVYGFYFAKKAIRSKDNVYLVEGYTDVLSMFEAGIENVVASSGTALTEGQIKLIASQTQNITVLYDGDTAGIKASLRGIDLLIEAGLNVRVVQLPEGEDPDSFAKSHRDSELMDFLTENAVNFLIFKANVLSKDAGNDPIKKAEVVSEIIRTIAEVPDNIARALYVKECSALFNLPEDILNAQLRKEVWKKLNKRKDKPQEEIPLLPPTPVFQEKPGTGSDILNAIEKNIILLILKHGIYEIATETTDQDQKPIITHSRIDQYIFNEFHEEEIRFNTPLFQRIYEEYARIASIENEQDNIKKFFSMHEDQEIQNFAISALLNPDPVFSPDWESKFDIITNSITNNIQKLNEEVEQHINMFKFRLIENYINVLLKELELNKEEEILVQITVKYTKLLQRRRELADLLGVVISK